MDSLNRTSRTIRLPLGKAFTPPFCEATGPTLAQIKLSDLLSTCFPVLDNSKPVAVAYSARCGLAWISTGPSWEVAWDRASSQNVGPWQQDDSQEKGEHKAVKDQNDPERDLNIHTCNSDDL